MDASDIRPLDERKRDRQRWVAASPVTAVSGWIRMRSTSSACIWKWEAPPGCSRVTAPGSLTPQSRAMSASLRLARSGGASLHVRRMGVRPSTKSSRRTVEPAGSRSCGRSGRTQLPAQYAPM
ncbi:hypothetical protein ASD88_01695 [Pelomonas sp. Root662]|nr:hypothetical protein ASC81_01695 [Pelomonas sp. Root405]KRA77619.1 hypothetical protein ASD88_01695 [Pelomonas sp. Root662]